MLDHGGRNENGGIPASAEAKPEVHILHVTEKCLIKTPDLHERCASVKRCGSTGARGLVFHEVAGSQNFSMPPPPTNPGWMVEIAEPVHDFGCGIEHLKGTEGGCGGMAVRGGEEVFEPVGLWNGIRVQQSDKFGVAHRDGLVVGGGKAEVFWMGANIGDCRKIWFRGEEFAGFFERSVDAGVIDEKKAAWQDSLGCDRFEATKELSTRIEIDNNQRAGVAHCAGK